VNHCVNCGSELTGAECERCGMDVFEAERSTRRGLMNRLAIFLLGAIGFLVPCFFYPPLEVDRILIFIGVVFFAALALAFWAERRVLRHEYAELLKRLFYAMVPIPWLLGLLLLANGALDRSPPQDFNVKVVSRFAMPGILPMHQLVVTSWRDGHDIERIYVSKQDYDLFQDGDPIDVRVRDGLASIPWVFGVYHH
jgi:hypothetical protein